MTINILGTDYDIKYQSEEENQKFTALEATGLAELYSKIIYIEKLDKDDIRAYDNLDVYQEKVLRHELFHAIFHECGLSKYTEDEGLVECLAQLYPKIENIMRQAHNIHIKEKQ